MWCQTMTVPEPIQGMIQGRGREAEGIHNDCIFKLKGATTRVLVVYQITTTRIFFYVYLKHQYYRFLCGHNNLKELKGISITCSSILFYDCITITINKSYINSSMRQYNVKKYQSIYAQKMLQFISIQSYCFIPQVFWQKAIRQPTQTPSALLFS